MDSTTSPLAILTTRQAQCLRLAGRRLTAKEIGRDLGISHHAVEKHLAAARTRLGVASTGEAVRLIADAGKEKPYYHSSALPHEDAISDRSTAAEVIEGHSLSPSLNTHDETGLQRNRLSVRRTLALIMLVAIGAPAAMAILMSLALGAKIFVTD